MQNGSNICSFTSDRYHETLLGRIRQFRSSRDLCDVTLEADGVLFPAHKVILAAASSYCKLLFSETKVEGNIKLKGVRAKGLRNVLDFIYSNKLSLTLTNIEETLKAAEVLLVREAEKLCFQFLEDGLNQGTCVDILNIVKKHGPEELKEKASGRIGQQYQHLPKVSEGLSELSDHAKLSKPLLELSDILKHSKPLSELSDHLTQQDILNIVKKHGPEELKEKASGRIGQQYQHLPKVSEHLSELNDHPKLSKPLSELSDHLTQLDILNILKKHGPEEVKEKASGRIGQQYQRLPKVSERLSELSGHLTKLDKTALCEILEQENVPGLSELDLFRMAVEWLQLDSSRLKEAADVLRRIRFSLIPLEDLQKYVKETPVMKTDSECFRYLQEAFRYHSQIYAQPVLHCEGANMRSCSERLLVLGGRTTDNQVCSTIWLQNQDGSSWSELGEMCSPVYNHCVAVLNDFLFIMGGQSKFDPSGKHPSNEVFRYDPRSGSWLQAAGMLERRTRFHTEVIGERIIAVGGGSLLGHLTHSVEEYHPAENKWDYTSPFPIPVADHAGTTHKGILYISGGYSTGRTLNDVYSYLPRLKRWVVNRSMTYARCDHGMATIRDKIFCIGGRTLNAASEWIHVNETEYYCPAADQWSTLKLSPFGCCQFSISNHQSKLFITGGGSLKRMNKEDGVFVYDPEAKTWKKMGSLPCPLVDHASCTINLPRDLKEKIPEMERGEMPSTPNTKRSTLNLFVTGKQEA